MAVRTTAAAQYYSVIPNLGTQSKVSITCWVKISVDRNATSVAWILMNSAATVYVTLATDTTGTTMQIIDQTAAAYLISGPNMTVGTWYFIGASWDGINGTMVYQALNASAPTTLTASTFQSSYTAYKVALNNDTATNFLNGCTCAVKGWIGTTLTAEQLQQEMWSYLPKAANPTFWYPFLRTETPDYSGNGYTLTGGTGATTEDGPGVGWGYRRSGLYIPVVTAVTHDLASAGLASSSGAADANALYPLASDGLASSSGAAVASILFPLVSDGLAGSSGSAILNTLGSMVSDGLASSSGVALALLGVVLASDGVATSSGVADAQVISGLASDGLAASVGAGSLVAAVTLEASGLATSTSAAEANLEFPLTGVGIAASAGFAAAQVEGGLAAAGVAASAGTAGLQAMGVLAAAGQAVEAATGALTATWSLGAVGQATSSGSAEVVVGFIFAGFATSSGSASLSLTITLGTAVGLEATTGDNELGVDTLIGADARGSSSGRAVLYIALPWHPNPTGAPGRGPGGGVAGPTGRTQASGVDTGRTRG